MIVALSKVQELQDFVMAEKKRFDLGSKRAKLKLKVNALLSLCYHLLVLS